MKSRLLRLAEFLDTLDPTQFNIRNWVTDPDGKCAGDGAVPGCGYAGCAVGWACVLPEFVEAGLRLVDGAPRWGNAPPEDFFGITEDEFDYLFMSGMYEDCAPEDVTPKMVAERIREVWA